MIVTKEYVNRYTRKLYKFLNAGHKINFTKQTTTRGYIYVDVPVTEVHLDPRDRVISTLVHETLHYFYPKASETWILEMERKIVRQLTDRQVKNIIRCLAKSL